MASAQVVGANGAPNMADRVDSRWKETSQHPPFGCVLMRKAALDALGPLNDKASDLVGAEVELSNRARAHGLPVVMCRCRVKHREPEVNPFPLPSRGIEQLALAGRN